MMTLQEMELQIIFLQSEVNRLNNRLLGLPQSSGTTAKSLSNQNYGSLPFLLKRILNLGFVWVSNKVNVKAAALQGISVSIAGVATKRKANYGISCDADGLLLLIEANQGLEVGASGVATKRRTFGGINADSTGLYLSVIERNTVLASQLDKTTDIVLEDIPGLTFDLEEDKTYLFEADLFIDADITGGHKYSLSGTVTPLSLLYTIDSAFDLGSGNLVWTTGAHKTALDDPMGYVSAAYKARISGIITVDSGGAGTLLIQFAQEVSNNTSSVIAGSYLTIKEIT